MDLLIIATDYLEAVDKLDKLQRLKLAFERMLGIIGTNATVADKAMLKVLLFQTYENIKSAEIRATELVAKLSKNTEE